MASSGQDKRIDYIEFNVSVIGRARRFYGVLVDVERQQDARSAVEDDDRDEL